MLLLISAQVALLAIVALVGQIMVTLLFAREAILTKEGAFCRVKCIMAAMMYGTVAVLLALYFLG